MSLKAKIEAVIYASEEPVTLAQLIGLLGEEAQAELDRAVAAQQALALGESADAPAEPDAPQPALSLAKGLDSETWDKSDASEPPPAEAANTASAPDAAADAAKTEKARAQKLRAFFRGELDRLIAEYSAPASDRGIEVREVAGGFLFSTKPEYHDAVRGFVKSLKPPLKLTLPALETLAVIAYKQPVTAPEISEVRGVDSSGTLSSLIARKLITTAGRKQVIGRPMLYKTSKEFLLKFGLRDLGELPSIEEFEKMAGQLAEQEEILLPEPSEQRLNTDELAQELGPKTGGYTPHANQSAGEGGDLDPVDSPTLDGRISAPPPDYAAEDLADDPSAEEAAIQSGEGVE